MKKYLAMILALVMSLSLVACGGGKTEAPAKTEEPAQTEEPAASGEQEYNISVILKTTSSEYWGYVVAGAEAYEKDHPNVHVEVKGSTSETA